MRLGTREYLVGGAESAFTIGNSVIGLEAASRDSVEHSLGVRVEGSTLNGALSDGPWALDPLPLHGLLAPACARAFRSGGGQGAKSSCLP